MSSYGGHGVPAEQKEASAATMRASVNLHGEPTDAERSRTLMTAKAFGSLATMSTECPGFPFGSLVGYAVDEVGRPLLCLSRIAEHSRNMAANPNASLMVTEHDGGNNLLALARVTLVGECRKISDSEHEAGLDLYLQAHPSAFYSSFHDFSIYRLEVASVRYVGGFGRMSWVTAEQYTAAEPDTLLEASAGVISHMNADHADAVLDYCKAFGRLDAVAAELVGVDRYGMDILASLANDENKRAVRVNFTEKADSSDAVRQQTIALLREARAQLATG
ncbi:MAG: HugZ family pyridoxamine 5'-phosphate oxidase [Sporichthyaceae bacterium]